MKALEILKNEILIKERAVEVIGWGIHNLFEYREALQELEDLQSNINTSIEEIKYALVKPEYANAYLNNALRFLGNLNEEKA